MNESEKQLALAEFWRDQARANIYEHIKDVRRIADGGYDGSERDKQILRVIANFVVGDVLHARLDADVNGEDFKNG